LSWLVFPNSSFQPIPLTTIVPNARVLNNNITGDYPEHDNMNPTKGLGPAQRGEPSHQMAMNGNNDNGCSGSDDHRSSSSGSDHRKHRLPPTYNAPKFSVKHASCDNDNDDGHIDNNDDNDNDRRDDEEEQEGENNEGENNEEEQDDVIY